MADGKAIYTQDRDGNVYRMLPSEEVIQEGEQRAVRNGDENVTYYEGHEPCPNCALFIETIATLSTIIKENQANF